MSYRQMNIELRDTSIYTDRVAVKKCPCDLLWPFPFVPLPTTPFRANPRKFPWIPSTLCKEVDTH